MERHLLPWPLQSDSSGQLALHLTSMKSSEQMMHWSSFSSTSVTCVTTSSFWALAFSFSSCKNTNNQFEKEHAKCLLAVDSYELHHTFVTSSSLFLAKRISSKPWRERESSSMTFFCYGKRNSTRVRRALLIVCIPISYDTFWPWFLLNATYFLQGVFQLLFQNFFLLLRPLCLHTWSHERRF